MKMASWSSVSEHLVNPIGMSDQLKWNNQGSSRTLKFTDRVRKEAAREEGFKDTRGTKSGRPSTKNLTIEEQLERLKQKNKILQQENNFLKRVRFINRKQILKLQKDKQ